MATNKTFLIFIFCYFSYIRLQLQRYKIILKIPLLEPTFSCQPLRKGQKRYREHLVNSRLFKRHRVFRTGKEKNNPLNLKLNISVSKNIPSDLKDYIFKSKNNPTNSKLNYLVSKNNPMDLRDYISNSKNNPMKIKLNFSTSKNNPLKTKLNFSNINLFNSKYGSL